jgi:hypothetical protein
VVPVLPWWKVKEFGLKICSATVRVEAVWLPRKSAMRATAFRWAMLVPPP